jgi:hypothetical protein
MPANKVDDFRLQIENLDKDFVCQTPLPATSASISFLGPFQGQVILWNMTLATLAHYQANENQPISATEAGTYKRPFIAIKGETEGVFQIEVGLDLPLIDEPVIRKTIIMIRNYKRLAIGRIEFGSMHT